MRIIKQEFLKGAAQRHPRAAVALEEWIGTVTRAGWKNPVEMAQSFPSVDPVKVRSKRTVYVFNIRRNEFRLIVAVHFNRKRIYTLRFFTHADYSRLPWKEQL